MTKRMKEAYERYLNSNNYNLYYVYNYFSSAKAEAWEYCKELCKDYGGSDLKVIGANSNFFSAGFTFTEDDIDKFMFITHGGNYIAEI